MYTGDESNLVPFSVDHVTLHPDWDEDAITSDIALIDMETLFNFPVAGLPTTDGFSASADLIESNTVTVIGYGDTLSDDDDKTFRASGDLLKAELSPKTTGACLSDWGLNFVSSVMICAEGDDTKDTCQGDSGGPLVMTATSVLYGITSFGPSQCGIGSGVYTKVLNFVDWINDPNAVDSDALDPEVDAPVEDEEDESNNDSTTPSNSSPISPFTPVQRSAGPISVWLLIASVFLFSSRRKT